MRRAVACVILSLSLALPFPLPAAAERPSDVGELLLWLLGLKMMREQATPRRIDVNSATVEQLASVPGLERRQAQQITGNRPYAKLEDLARAGLSPGLIEHLAPLLTVDPTEPSALPGPAQSTPPQR